MADDERGTEIRVERRDERDGRETESPAAMDVRDEDLEPHAGLRYIARMFKVMALLILLLFIAEIIMGLVREGQGAIPTLLIAGTRLVVFAALMWGAGDLALMLIESNHDLRATRILVGRLNGKVARLEAHYLPRSATPSRSRARGGAITGDATDPATYTPDAPQQERPPSHREGLG
ncbi:MAG TPA: hypothetical protein VNP72_07855 [Longimicrobium sp.]|nr:hypothetical protein [Longimicrobium sp.]